MNTKKQYRVTTLLPKGVEFTIDINAYGISWIPNETRKQLRVNCPDTYLFAEIIKIEKLP